MRYDPAIIEQVSSLNDVVEVVSSYISLKKAGRSFKGCCPFHTEKTPSFFVNPDKQIYHCFGCGAGGDVITFVQKMENVDFPEALEILAKKVNFELPRSNFDGAHKRSQTKSLEVVYEKAQAYYRNLFLGNPGAAARKYMENRSFSKEATDSFEVGYATDVWRGLTDALSREGIPEGLLLKSGLVSRSAKGSLYDQFRGRVLFPIRNTQGKIIGFGGRVISLDGKPKYLNSPETDLFKKGKELFSLNIAKKHLIGENSRIFIVEGYLDCLRMHAAGIQNTVATLGTALTGDHVRLLRRYADEAVLIFDGDKAGASAAFRSLDVFLEEGFPVKVVSLEGGLDPDDYLREKGKDAFLAKLDEAQDFFEFKLKILSGKYSDKDSLGLLKITSSFLEVISKMPSEILQDHYLQKLGKVLRVNENSLRQELAKTKKRFKTSSPQLQANPVSQESQQKHQKEETLLLYLLSEEEGLKVIEEVETNLFLSNITQRIFEILKETRRDHPKGSCLSAFLARLENPEIKQQIAELSFLEWNSEDRQKALEDCLQYLRKGHIQKRQKALEAKIRSAEENGEFDRLAEYLKDFQDLSAKGKK